MMVPYRHIQRSRAVAMSISSDTFYHNDGIQMAYQSVNYSLRYSLTMNRSLDTQF